MIWSNISCSRRTFLPLWPVAGLLSMAGVAGCHRQVPPAVAGPTATAEAPPAWSAADYAIDLGAIRAAMRDVPACHQQYGALQQALRAMSQAARLPEREAFASGMAAIDQALAANGSDSQAALACPAMRGARAMVRAFAAEKHLQYKSLHDADAPLTVPVAGYVALHDQAVADALLHSRFSWDAWRAQGANVPPGKRRQRYMENFGTDERIVRVDGSMGLAVHAEPYVGLVDTPVLAGLTSRLTALQGQGPLLAEDALAYARAALARAAVTRAPTVVFVNMAGGQVPSFADAVAEASRSTVIDASYVQLDGWQDGHRFGADSLAQFADSVATALGRTPNRAELVVNCYSGLDRSGILNALVQLILQARQARREGKSAAHIKRAGVEAIDAVVAGLKQARPRSISSPSRYQLLHEAFAAWTQLPPPAAVHEGTPEAPAAPTVP